MCMHSDSFVLYYRVCIKVTKREGRKNITGFATEDKWVLCEVVQRPFYYVIYIKTLLQEI